MACATPVIGTRTGGLLELIRDGENGWLVPMRDEKALAAKIGDVLALASARLERIGQTGAAMVRQHYTWEATARETNKIYRTARLQWQQRRIPSCHAHSNG